MDTAVPSLRVKALAREAGFDLARITSAVEMHQERARYLAWLQDGRQGEMRWMTPERAVNSTEPTHALPGARSVLCLGLAYGGGIRPADVPLSGRIARYAWGHDYHIVMGERLSNLAGALAWEFGGEHRWYVDTGPLMDKALAARSGLGWYGKNTNILTERFGSFLVLGEIISTLELEVDVPLDRRCGSCRLCIVACPTGALGPEYSIDSRRCISYLTIEHRAPIPRELRPAIGTWVFGCDICQDVCPPSMEPFLQSEDERREWKAGLRAAVRGLDGAVAEEATIERPWVRVSSTPLYRDRMRPSVDLLWLLRLSHAEYVEAFRGTAIRRAKVWMLRRNAAVALGNCGDPGILPHLIQALMEDEHPLVRGHAAWAAARVASRHGQSHVVGALRAALRSEQDPQVLEEIGLALTDLAVPSGDGSS